MRLVASVSTALLLGVLNAGAVSPGDSVDSVREELGVPNGFIEIGSTRLLFYDRGDVVMMNDQVVDHNLMSEGEYAEKIQREAERKAILSRLAEKRRLQLEAEGLELKLSKLDDPAFSSLSAVERITFWQTFQDRYPMVPVDLELNAAFAEYESTLLADSNRALALRINQLETQIYEYQILPYQFRRSSGTVYLGGATYGVARYSVPYAYKTYYRYPANPHYWYISKPHHRSPSKPHYQYPSKPDRRSPGHHTDRPRDRESNQNFNSEKGATMATTDRARGRHDNNYSRSRNATYARINP